jgi:predicted peroxiredoxin
MRTLFSIILTTIIFFTSSCCTSNTDTKGTTNTAGVVETKQEQQNATNAKDGVFIHLSSGPEDPQRVLMALNMAKMMSDDKEVLVYIDIKGVFTVLKNAPDVTFKEFPSSLTLLNELKEIGVQVIVCPGCLKAADKTSDDVMEWVQIATKDKFFDFCDGKIISIDY